MVKSREYDFWSQVAASALMGQKIRISKKDLEGRLISSPGKSGLFVRSLGKISGQDADWRSPVESSRRGVHVVDFPDRFEVHADRFDPAKMPLEHLVFDYGPVVLKTVLISMIGRYLFSRTRKR